MKKIKLEELKSIQLEILNTVVAFCDKNDIHYWLDSGTLLGAVRHKGYIPWDDDIDIGMLRSDYEKFISTFNRSGDRYRCCTFNNTPNFPFGFAKVIDVQTELYEPSKEKGLKISINIDIFVYDNAPSDAVLLKKMYDKGDRCIAWLRRRALLNMTTGGHLKQFLGTCLRLLLKALPWSLFCNLVEKNQKRYAAIETGYVGNFSDQTRMICTISAVKDYCMVEFEGKTYKAPCGYDEWLRSIYGDYMELPPKENRVSHHVFEAYIQDD